MKPKIFIKKDISGDTNIFISEINISVICYFLLNINVIKNNNHRFFFTLKLYFFIPLIYSKTILCKMSHIYIYIYLMALKKLVDIRTTKNP